MMRDAVDLLWMLWWHGAFPLRFVIYSGAAAFVAGVLVGWSS